MSTIKLVLCAFLSFYAYSSPIMAFAEKIAASIEPPFRLCTFRVEHEGKTEEFLGVVVQSHCLHAIDTLDAEEKAHLDMDLSSFTIEIRKTNHTDYKQYAINLVDDESALKDNNWKIGDVVLVSKDIQNRTDRLKLWELCNLDSGFNWDFRYVNIDAAIQGNTSQAIIYGFKGHKRHVDLYHSFHRRGPHIALASSQEE